MMTGARLLSAVAALLAITSVAAAQSDSGDPLAEIRNRASFTAAEDQVIDQWISDRLAELKGADPDRRWRAAREFREAFQNEVNNSQSSPRYLRRLAERFTPVATQEFRNPDQNKDEAVQVAVAWALVDLKQVPTMDALLVGLQNGPEAVRFLAARAYQALQPAISADTQLTRTTIQRLARAGAAEANPAIRGAIFEAMQYPDSGLLDEVVDGIATVLSADVEARVAQERLRAERAELIAYEFLYRNRNSIPQATRADLVRPLAALLALDVRRYPSAVEDELPDLQERIDVEEQLLEALAGQGGDVSEAMKKGGPTAETEMKAELAKWVGGENQQGALNRAPWNVPSGGAPRAGG